jgi:three-Cys-motif partner protein
MTTKNPSADHRFGGDWTSRKLAVIAAYLTSYTTALKNAPFKKAFIDAFAGTGYRRPRRNESDGAVQPVLFPDLAADAPQALLDGSARLALQTVPRFDKYIFIERNEDRSVALKNLKVEFPAMAADIHIRAGDANAELQALCRLNWSGHRAVLFLDPYGMQVEWKTIEAVAATKAIDMWLLFPLGMGINRVLTKSGDIPASWRSRVDVLLGNETWYEEFYRVVATQTTLLGEELQQLEKASMETIGRSFTERLRTIFAGVAEPGVLRNSTNNPLYLLCFACGNDRGKPVALRIAKHLLKDLH